MTAVNLDRLNQFLDIAYSTVYHEPTTPNFHSVLIDTFYNDIFKPLNLNKDAKILDVGCGSGYFLSKLNNDGYTDALGLTYDNADIEECKKINVNAIKQDFTFTTFDDHSFDFIWCRHALEHSVWPFFTLLEFNRLLKLDAMAYIEVPAPDLQKEHEKNENHFSILGERMWRELFIRAGFKVSFFKDYHLEVRENFEHNIEVSFKEIYYLFLIQKVANII